LAHFGCRIRPVAVDHDVNVRVDAAKHRLDHEAFALPRLRKYSCARCARARNGHIGRVVIEDVNAGVRQLAAKIANHLGNR
jgi:hypothetical protein